MKRGQLLRFRKAIPHRLLILGGGAVGVEMAQAVRRRKLRGDQLLVAALAGSAFMLRSPYVRAVAGAAQLVAQPAPARVEPTWR